MKQIKITLIFVVSLFFIKSIANAEIVKPQSTSEFKQTSVRIYNSKRNSGGTGSILQSSKSGSTVLTNKHVCRLVEQGGYVEQAGNFHEIKSYKKFPDHDLCLVKIDHNFNVELKISKSMAKSSDTVYVSGHPSLLPHIVSRGHLSDNLKIRLIVGLKDCAKPSFICSVLGGSPIFQTFDSQVVSNFIMPGSSGSAVFNDDGEVVGVVFAGMGELSYGFIVPQKYILYFLTIAQYSDFVKTGTPVDSNGVRSRIFNYNNCKTEKKTKALNKVCRKSKHSMIYIRTKND